jgi:hypothetical protein
MLMNFVCKWVYPRWPWGRMTVVGGIELLCHSLSIIVYSLFELIAHPASLPRFKGGLWLTLLFPCIYLVC